jgi:hypothetical protein
MKQLLRVGTAVAALGTLFVACGQAPTTQETSGQGGHGAAGAGTSSGGSGAGEFTFSTGTASNGGSGGEEACAGETSQAELVSLDLYLMLDVSGSMLEVTYGGPTKWHAITQALSAFFHDPSSAGLGVGLQRFPLRAPGVPQSCTASADCPGSSGPCLLKICSNQLSLLACTTNADCPFASQCVPLGKCGTALCAPANGAACNGSSQACNPITESTCAHEDSCDPGDYAAPVVEIATLGAATSGASQLDSAIAALAPGGATPTAPALGGAIQHARAFAAQNPTHKVVVVLATDGLPTECAPLDVASIAQIAATGLSGSPGVETFAIGVFAPSDITAGAKQNLDQIAAAGGTSKAFIVDTSQNVEQQFTAALDAIRGSKLACEYTVPTASSAGPLDFGKVNIEHTPPGASAPQTIGYVGSVQGCDPTDGGWYYDVDPSTGQTPTKIVMCPATCSGFTAMNGGQVEIRVGCKTVIGPVPK